MAHYLSVKRRRKDKFPGANFFVIIPPMVKSYDIAMFHPSDGLTPLQAKKLNENFQRVLGIISHIDEEGESIVRITNAVQDKLQPLIMDAAYPIGCLILAKDTTSLPKWGKWREVTDANNRFIRIGDYGQTGGSSSQTITATTKRHRHTYVKQVADTKVKVDTSTATSAKEVIATLKDSADTSYTSYEGDGQDQTISTIPPYMSMKLFERYE